MKRKITSIAVALMATMAVGVTASADYYLTANKSGSDVKVEVIADKATLPAMQFTVTFPSGVTAKNVTTPSGAYYNSENGIYAWAATEAPTDGTVMFSAEFAASNGEFTVTPATGFSTDLPVMLKATIADGTVTVVELPKPSEDTTSTPSEDTSAPSEDTSTPSGDTSAPSGDTSAPSGDTSTPSGDTSTSSGDTSTPSGDTSTSSGDTSKPTGDTSSSSSGASSNTTSSENTDNESGENPPTGVTGGVASIAVAGIASFVAIKTRKQK